MIYVEHKAVCWRLALAASILGRVVAVDAPAPAGNSGANGQSGRHPDEDQIQRCGGWHGAARPPTFGAVSGDRLRGRPRGHVITNAHGLPDLLDPQGKETLAVFIGRDKQIESRSAIKVAIDPVHDLALLKFEGAPLPPLRLGESKPLREGDEVALTGFPLGVVLGLFPVTHTGIVAAISPIAIPAAEAAQLDGPTLKRLRQEPYKVLQLDATAYPGNSGSPLYEPGTGRVVGVVNKVFVQQSKEAALDKPSGITYAIPIRHAQELLKRAGVQAK